jgi:hypothetical protein
MKFFKIEPSSLYRLDHGELGVEDLSLFGARSGRYTTDGLARDTADG